MSRSSFITVCMSLLAAMAQLGAAPRALAQITDRTIEQIKTESLLRAERGAYPLGGLDLQDVTPYRGSALATRMNGPVPGVPWPIDTPARRVPNPILPAQPVPGSAPGVCTTSPSGQRRPRAANSARIRGPSMLICNRPAHWTHPLRWFASPLKGARALGICDCRATRANRCR